MYVLPFLQEYLLTPNTLRYLATALPFTINPVLVFCLLFLDDGTLKGIKANPYR